ncbi:hypothetical protein M409DRAFT_52355 [Zasmidium cellare ATCC 36951]|uniref:Mid2 domain-containing protein n=1 Tax=Zasmidium cellare ATCC 36951 TaxID=1080233 RepID=A0A6A6CVQ1_ZASCE|nr:uncharacterized protein M409DRAFT_52355 [Zasmidium cellare ATCC 36951]KAF2169869.1 hypothetical protein M409DRAFT_52355 [Zasmidium cellare ATCC 36951]
MALSHLLVSALLFHSICGHLITPAAIIPARASQPATVGSGGDKEVDVPLANQLFKRDTLFCDGATGAFKCTIGTCYTGLDGFVGCCSVSNCKPRTTCMDWHPSVAVNVDVDTVGFMYCSDPSLPLCNTLSNSVADQYIIWCGATGGLQVTGYPNPVTKGSMASDLPSPFDSGLLFPSTTTEFTEKLTAKATPSVVTVVSTQALPTATSSPTEDEQTKEAGSKKEHDSTPHGAIVGIAMGATAGGVLLLAALWYFRHTRKSNGNAHGDGEKPTSPSPDTSRPPSNDSQGSPYAASKSLAPIDTKNSSPVSRFPGHPNRLNDIGSPTSSAVEFGSLQRYTVTNPDLTSPGETAAASPVEAPSSPYTFHAPKLQQNTSPTSLVSPLVGDTTRDSTVSALWPSPARPPSSTFTPYTPSNYAPSAPSSLPRSTNLQPPSLPQPYSTATFATTTTSSCAPYTPSTYRSEAPDSIPPTLRPSCVLPQEYSAATVESERTEARSPVYRGLSGNAAPSDFLSAERAIGGGWENGSPTRGER